MRKYIREVGPYKVISNADGTLTIYPDGNDGASRDGSATKQTKIGWPAGTLDRMGFAETIVRMATGERGNE